MKRKLLEDAIIIAGEVHQLIDDHLGDECERCSLQGLCNSGKATAADFMLCNIEQRYQKIGTIDDVLAKEQHRKEARHHLAVLIQHTRWLKGSVYKEVTGRMLDEAYDFAIQELKELYK